MNVRTQDMEYLYIYTFLSNMYWFLIQSGNYFIIFNASNGLSDGYNLQIGY